MSTTRVNILDLNGGVNGTVKGSDIYPAVDVTDFSQASDGTTKRYSIVDLFDFMMNALGLVTYDSCVAATTANLISVYNNGISGVGATLTNATTQLPFTVDGQAGVVNQRYLVKNQTNAFENGIYTLTVVGTGSTNWVLTRSTDFNSSSNIVNNGNVFVTLGTVNENTYWEDTFTGSMVVGTTLITWTPFSLSPNVLFTWNLVTGTSQTVSENNGYVPSNVALTTFTLPTTANFGDSFKIMGLGTGGFRIAQNAGQLIHLGSSTTTTGILGYLESTNAFDNLEIVCLVANTVFSARAVIGNITVN